MSALRVVDATMNFGGLRAVSNLSFDVRPGVITALIGPNGAGKTTMFNMISGLLRPTSGEIGFDGHDLTRMAPHEICRIGIGRSFQTPQSFGPMTVLENVMVAAQVRGTLGFISAGLSLPSARREEADFRQRALAHLGFLQMRDLAPRIAGTLGLGEQRMLDLARALATEPRVLLLDEPAAGLTQAEVRRLRETLLRIRERGIAVLLVEHNMRFVLSSADHVVVLNFGSKLAEGPPSQITKDPKVVAAYLGHTAEQSHA